MTASVLVVDDDQAMVRTLCDVLQRRGFTTGGAGSGEQAVDLAREREWSVVLMDVRMPGMDGVRTFQALRQIRPQLPVILMTAYSSAEVLRDAAESGIAHVLAKPFAMPKLLALLTATVSPPS